MVEAIFRVLESTEVMPAQTAGGLQVFCLRRATLAELKYATLDEALAAHTLEITEVSEGGSVPTLRLLNRSGILVFLMAGEQLVGAKQNRVLNTSLLVPGPADLPIPVSCVEAHRWRYHSPQFASGGTLAYGKLRRYVTRMVAVNYRTAGRAASDQAGVWAEVSDMLAKTGTASPTQAMQKVYEDHEAKIGILVDKLLPPDGCCGAAFAIAGVVIGADLFDQPSTLRRLWNKLVRSYALEAFMLPPETTSVSADAVVRLLRSAAQAKLETFKSPALGDDVRLRGAGVVGSGLVVNGQAVHVQLFSEN